MYEDDREETNVYPKQYSMLSEDSAKSLVKRKPKSYGVRNRTREIMDTLLSPLRSNSVKELTSPFRGSFRRQTMAIITPSETSTINSLIIRDNSNLERPSNIRDKVSLFESRNKSNEGPSKSNEKSASSKRSSFRHPAVDRNAMSIDIKTLPIKEPIKESASPKERRKSGFFSFSHSSKNSTEESSSCEVKNHSRSTLKLFKLFSGSSTSKDESSPSMKDKVFRKTKSYSCRSASNTFGHLLPLNISSCSNTLTDNQSSTKSERSLVRPSSVVGVKKIAEVLPLSPYNSLCTASSPIRDTPPEPPELRIPQIQINDDSDLMKIKMRAPPKKYYGSHTTSTYTASTGEDVPDATPRRKLIGFLHRTSHLSLTSEATDENSLHIAGQTSSCYESEEDRSKHDTDKNYFSSDGTDISFKQDFRAKTLRTHRNMNVVLNMKTNDFLGISLIGQASYNCDKGIFIADIMSGGAVAQNGRISIGDELLEVNGNSFLHFSNDQAVELLKNEILKRGPIRLKISKRFPTIAANPLVSKSFGSLKRDGLTRKSLHVSPSYRGTDMQLDEQVWVPQKSSSMRDVMRHLNPTQTMMPAIKETHENPNSISPSALRRQTPVKSSRKNSIRSSNGKQYNMDSDKEDVVQAMCLPNSYLEAKERTWLKITHPMCFLGKHLLDWLLSNVEGMNDRRVAKMYAFELLQEKLIVHVICRYTFSEQCYYVFGEEIEKKKKERESNAECSYMI